MYAAKAASGGGPPGQVQGQQGVPSSGQGMECSPEQNLLMIQVCCVKQC